MNRLGRGLDGIDMMDSGQFKNAPAPTLRASGSLRRLVDLFSNVWLGIAWAILLFIYCSVGSAMPTVRQHPALEMTEFQWFHWWPFKLLIGLLCTTLIVTTVRRIPLRWVNAGVWTIHTGIIVLCLGSYYYFGTKIEGDTPVFRRRVEISVPGATDTAYLPALPGNQISVVGGIDRWQFQIQSTNAAWPIRSKDHEGEIAYSVNVLVTPPTGKPFIRQLLAGYPQYTEDIIPGSGRAVKSTGRKLIAEDLGMTLGYEPQEYFHIMDTWALYTRRAGDTEWTQRPIHNMPRYHDRIGSRDRVFSEPQQRVAVRSMDLPVPPPPDGDVLGNASLRITGYLRYAHFQERRREGADRLNPVLRASLLPDGSAPIPLELVAFDQTASQSADGLVQFVWLNDFSLVDTLPTDARAVLHVEVPDRQVAFDVPITADTVVGAKGEFTKIDGTDFAYRIHAVKNNLALPGRDRSVSVAIVAIETPEGRVTRMVADQPSKTRDMAGENGDPHATATNAPQKPDPRIQMTYRPQTAPILLAAYPKGLYLVVNGPNGRELGRDVEIGESVEVVPGLAIRADALWTHAVSEIKPYVVPPASRRRDVGEMLSMVRIEIDTGSDIQSRWLRFNQYAFPNQQYAYSGRFTYTPERFRLDDGTQLEIMFSRERHKLPNPIALESFALDTHVGGYTGKVHTIRNYVSHLRFLEQDQWTEVRSIMVNAPTEYAGLWYFQSMWDKPQSGNPTGGMNYTGLGVGNRNGVHIQLAGCCIAVTGMLFAFYVKPVIKRRRSEQSRARLSEREETEPADSGLTPTAETVEAAVVENRVAEPIR